VNEKNNIAVLDVRARRNKSKSRHSASFKANKSSGESVLLWRFESPRAPVITDFKEGRNCEGETSHWGSQEVEICMRSADENEPGCSFSSEFRKRARKTLLYGRPFLD